MYALWDGDGLFTSWICVFVYGIFVICVLAKFKLGLPLPPCLILWRLFVSPYLSFALWKEKRQTEKDGSISLILHLIFPPFLFFRLCYMYCAALSSLSSHCLLKFFYNCYPFFMVFLTFFQPNHESELFSPLKQLCTANYSGRLKQWDRPLVVPFLIGLRVRNTWLCHVIPVDSAAINHITYMHAICSKKVQHWRYPNQYHTATRTLASV